VKGVRFERIGKNRHYNVVFHMGSSYVPVTDEIVEELKEQGELMGSLWISQAFADTSVSPIRKCFKGLRTDPAPLLCQRDGQDQPIHVVWGIPKDVSSPAVVVTAYRPDPARWSEDFLRRNS
jgi:hypothetical protein